MKSALKKMLQGQPNKLTLREALTITPELAISCLSDSNYLSHVNKFLNNHLFFLQIMLFLRSLQTPFSTNLYQNLLSKKLSTDIVAVQMLKLCQDCFLLIGKLGSTLNESRRRQIPGKFKMLNLAIQKFLGDWGLIDGIPLPFNKYHSILQKLYRFDTQNFIFFKTKERNPFCFEVHSNFEETHTILCKSEDNQSQEMLVMQHLKLFDEILRPIGLELFPYSIQNISPTVTFIEFIKKTMTVSQIIKKYISLNKYFQRKDSLETALLLNNFARSLAGYSLFIYFAQVKDRHNSNILLRDDGKLIHIDFGFVLGRSPGSNLNIESEIKLPNDYFELMGPEYTKLFKELFKKGYKRLMRQRGVLKLHLRMLKSSSEYFKEVSYQRMSQKYQSELCQRQLQQLLEQWNIGSRVYDYFQYLSEGISF